MTIKEFSGIYFCLADGNSDVIYNKISKPGVISLYPDIYFRHPFEESELVDPIIYDTAADMLRRYGSSHCVFLSLKDPSSLSYTAHNIADVYNSLERSPILNEETLAALNGLCTGLALSATMSAALKQAFTYYAACGNDAGKLIDEVRFSCRLPVSTKKEGKKIYAGLYQHIMG